MHKALYKMRESCLKPGLLFDEYLTDAVLHNFMFLVVKGDLTVVTRVSCAVNICYWTLPSTAAFVVLTALGAGLWDISSETLH